MRDNLLQKDIDNGNFCSISSISFLRESAKGCCPRFKILTKSLESEILQESIT